MHMYLHWIACGKISIPYIIHEKRKVITTVQRPDFQHFRQHFGNEHYCMYNITHLDKSQFFVHFWKLQNLFLFSSHNIFTKKYFWT